MSGTRQDPLLLDDDSSSSNSSEDLVQPRATTMSLPQLGTQKSHVCAEETRSLRQAVLSRKSTIVTRRRLTIQETSSSSDDDDAPMVAKKPAATVTAPSPSSRRTALSSPSRWKVQRATDHETTSEEEESSAKEEEEQPPPAVAHETKALDYPAQEPIYNNDDEGLDLRTMDVLMRQCWACPAVLQLPEDEFCWYARHEHPLLGISVCAVCCGAIAAVLATTSDNDDDDDDDKDACWGCGDDDTDVLFLCDDCDGAYCRTCVGQAHGGGRAGQHAVVALQASQESWQCLACAPTLVLQQLQAALLENETVQKPRTQDDVLAELELVEEERLRCIQQHEDDMAKKQEIREELQLNLHGDELEAAIEQEFDEYKLQLDQHEERLADMISSLHDELVLEYQLDLASVYQRLNPPPAGQAAEHDDDVSMPDWAALADRAIAKREKQLRKEKQPPPKISDETVYELTTPVDVEELTDDDKDDDESKPDLYQSGWSTTVVKPSKEEVAAALREEDELLKEMHIRKKVHKESDDRAHVLQEERDVVAAGRTGATRVRRDYQRIMQQRKSSKAAQSTGTRASKVCSGTRATARRPTTTTTTATTAASARGVPASPAATLSPTIPSTGTKRKHVDGGRAFADSSLVLCTPEVLDENGHRPVRTVAVARAIAEKLKTHQIEGVRFLWRNAFSDTAIHPGGDPSSIGGCILAHNMGLGKSLATIALLHTVLNHPSMSTKSGEPLFQTVLLVAPVNTLANWENEVANWTQGIDPTLIVHNMSTMDAHGRARAIGTWNSRGGIVLASSQWLATKKQVGVESLLKADILVIDEAHGMLKNRKTRSFEVLARVETKRRILLTGSPFQNNLTEYFHMVQYVRPGVLGVKTEAEFERKFRAPIEAGLPSDAPPQTVLESLELQRALKNALEPYVHRKDASVLRNDLPHMQQAVLHLRPTKIQTQLYNAFKKLQKPGDASITDYNNFLRMYSELRPIHNHPACLLQLGKAGKPSDRATPTADGEGSESKWWEDALRDVATLEAVENGSKIVVLLHILAWCCNTGEKVLIFSQCLKTLDYIEKVLAFENWTDHVPSLRTVVAEQSLGGWEKNVDFVRIDGGTGSGERGSLVDQFNNSATGNVRAFLISSVAGGIGINLHSANRVVLVDSHFNPAVTNQCVFRAYRYGQKKEVYCYRLLTEGTVEEKVYGRSVNKSGVARRVIDGKSFQRAFSARELADLHDTFTWVQCEDCLKWRMLLPGCGEVDFDGEWQCGKNEDEQNNSCSKPERPQKWYEKYIASLGNQGAWSPSKILQRDAAESLVADAASNKLLSKDELLQHLVGLEHKGPIVSRHLFHDMLLSSDQDTEAELDSVRRELNKEKTAAATEGHAGAATGRVDGTDSPAATVAPKELFVSASQEQIIDNGELPPNPKPARLVRQTPGDDTVERQSGRSQDGDAVSHATLSETTKGRKDQMVRTPRKASSTPTKRGISESAPSSTSHSQKKPRSTTPAAKKRASPAGRKGKSKSVTADEPKAPTLTTKRVQSTPSKDAMAAKKRRAVPEQVEKKTAEQVSGHARSPDQLQPNGQKLSTPRQGKTAAKHKRTAPSSAPTARATVANAIRDRKSAPLPPPAMKDVIDLCESGSADDEAYV